MCNWCDKQQQMRVLKAKTSFFWFSWENLARLKLFANAIQGMQMQSLYRRFPKYYPKCMIFMLYAQSNNVFTKKCVKIPTKFPTSTNPCMCYWPLACHHQISLKVEGLLNFMVCHHHTAPAGEKLTHKQRLYCSWTLHFIQQVYCK